MRFIKSIAILLLLLLLASCFDYSDEGKYWTESWIATTNIDGSEREFLIQWGGTPYYVADLDNPGEERIIIDAFHAVLSLNEDGTVGDYVLTDVGNIVEISQDRTKMVMVYNYDIYVANVDGTGLRNITNTTDIWEHDASISADNTKLVYSRYIYNQEVRSETLLIYDLMENTETELMRVDNITDFSVNNTCIVSNKVYYYFKFSVSETKPKGLYCIDIDTGIDSLVYNDSSLVDMITDYENSVYLLQASRTLLQLDINSLDSQVLYIEPTQRSYSYLVLGPSKENICLCGSQKYPLMYFIQTGDYVKFDRQSGKVSFNKNSTRLISTTQRQHPYDF